MTKDIRAKQKRLAYFIKPFEQSECQWGLDDCTALAARWAAQERGVEIALPSYSTREGAARIIAKAGGLPELWASYLEPVGIQETEFPQYGDIGLIKTERHGPVGVIFVHGCAIWRASSGFSYLSARPDTIIKAWSV